MPIYSNGCNIILWFIVGLLELQVFKCTKVEILFPEEVTNIEEGTFTLDYYPPEGTPLPNFTFDVAQSKNGLTVYNVTPGTEYVFQLYHTSDAASHELIWNKFVIVEPDPPTNLTYEVHTGKVVELSWSPPLVGGYTDFKLVRMPLSKDDDAASWNFFLTEKASSFKLQDLTPGATYEVKLYSVFKQNESTDYASVKFTTRPNNPGRFIVWFRNETTLMILWQPPFPSGIFDQYCTSITPNDAEKSVVCIDKAPNHTHGAFHGLVPGRAYNISVQTVSQNQSSSATVGRYYTLPLPPTNVTFHSVAAHSFAVRWSPPAKYSEFDKYQIMIANRSASHQTVSRDKERIAIFSEDINPVC